MWRHNRRGRAPKPPKPVKVKPPKIQDLRKTMKGLITVDLVQRTSVLADVLQWYDKAFNHTLLLRNGQLTLEQAKWYDTAAKCRILGGNAGASPAERENALEKSVRLYEKLVRPELQPPSIAKYYDVLTQKTDSLKLRHEQVQARYDRFVQLLTAALKPEDKQGNPAKMQVGVGGDKIQIDPSMSVITLRRDYAKQLFKKMRREGLYWVVVELLDPLSHLPAYEAEVDGMGNLTGRLLLTKGKQIAAIHKLLKNFGEFARTGQSPKRLVRPLLAPQPVPPGQPAPVQSKAPRHFGPKKGPKTAGLFVAGTDIAFVYTVLEDYQKHKKSDLQSKITTGLSGRLRVLNDRGISSGRFRVEQDTDEVWLVPLAPAQPAQGSTI